jgi:hypothetical protein
MANARTSDRLDTYLKEVRDRLRGLPVSEIDEVVRELRSHVFDSTAGDGSDAAIAAALNRLGDPQEIARLNLSLRVASDTLQSIWPWNVLRGIVRLARLSLRGGFDLLVSLVGYSFAASWLITALAKPFVPGRVGLWQLDDPSGDLSISLGFRSTAFAGHEILGWWIIPLGLVVGLASAWLTYRYDLAALRRIWRTSRLAKGIAA